MITTERARELAALSIAKRRENAAKLKEAIAINKGLSAFVDAQQGESGTFRASVHARIRKQIEMILEMLEEETRPQEVERLSRSLAALMEQDRIMSGIPLPGTLRPANQKSKKPSSISSPEPE